MYVRECIDGTVTLGVCVANNGSIMRPISPVALTHSHCMALIIPLGIYSSRLICICAHIQKDSRIKRASIKK